MIINNNFLIIFMVVLSVSENILADCLSYAKKMSESENKSTAQLAREISWFYRITEALYTQYNTSSRKPDAKEIPLYRKLKILLSIKNWSRQFFGQHEFKEFSLEIGKYNNLLREEQLEPEYKIIEAIHQGAIYGVKTPIFCKDFELANLTFSSVDT